MSVQLSYTVWRSRTGWRWGFAFAGFIESPSRFLLAVLELVKGSSGQRRSLSSIQITFVQAARHYL